MANTVTQNHRQMSNLLVGSRVSKSRSAKVPSTDRVFEGQDPMVHPAKGSPRFPVQLPKKIDYKSPNVRELTKDLVNRAKKPKVRLSNADHPVRRGSPKPIDGIFQRGRQRPTGPVRTFIVFKASSKHNQQVRRRKPKRHRITKLPTEGRFSPLPVYHPQFYKKSELKGKKLPKIRLSDQINVWPEKPCALEHSSGAAVKATNATALATSHNFAAINMNAEQRGVKKVGPQEPSAGPIEGAKMTSTTDEMAFAKKTHVGGGYQDKAKPKKKRPSVSILQKKPIRRRSQIYKTAKGKSPKRGTRSKSKHAKKPASLALSRKSLLKSILLPSMERTLKNRIANMQRMKRLEKEER